MQMKLSRYRARGYLLVKLATVVGAGVMLLFECAKPAFRIHVLFGPIHAVHADNAPLPAIRVPN